MPVSNENNPEVPDGTGGTVGGSGSSTPGSGATSSSFHEIRLDMSIVYGSKGGPSYKTFIMPLPSGEEQRIGFWSKGRNKWTITKEGLKQNEIFALESFYRARKGRLYGFRMRYWGRWLIKTATPEPLPLISNTTAQLQFVYPDSINAEVQKITKPVLVENVNNNVSSDLYSPDIILYQKVGSTYNVIATSQYSLNRYNGLVTFIASRAGQDLYWSGSYDWPVRFDTDDATFTREMANSNSWDSINLIELRQ